MSKFVFVAVACMVVVSAFGQNKVVFDNQSGDPALVKLIGPTKTDVQVPNGAKTGVDAAAGKYTIKVRYGTPGNYRYSKGEDFTVTETATARSETTITLHKVVSGNYDSHPITDADFGEVGSSRTPATGLAKAEAPTEVATRSVVKGTNVVGTAATETSTKSEVPRLVPSEEIVGLLMTTKQKEDSDNALAQGLPYYIWRSGDTYKRGENAPKHILLIPFFYVAKATAVPFQTEIVLEIKVGGSGEPKLISGKRQVLEYSEKGRSAVLYFDLDQSLGNSAGIAKARIRLLDYETGKKQISNEISADVEL